MGVEIPISVQLAPQAVNEFTQNNFIFTGAFPDLFPLGKCLGEEGSVSPAMLKNLLLFHDQRAGQAVAVHTLQSTVETLRVSGTQGLDLVAG